MKEDAVFLRVSVSADAKCRFSFSDDGKTFTPIGQEFTATAGRWVGAKVGIFAATVRGAQAGAEPGNPDAYADFDWFRVSAP